MLHLVRYGRYAVFCRDLHIPHFCLILPYFHGAICVWKCGVCRNTQASEIIVQLLTKCKAWIRYGSGGFLPWLTVNSKCWTWNLDHARDSVFGVCGIWRKSLRTTLVGPSSNKWHSVMCVIGECTILYFPQHVLTTKHTSTISVKWCCFNKNSPPIAYKIAPQN